MPTSLDGKEEKSLAVKQKYLLTYVVGRQTSPRGKCTRRRRVRVKYCLAVSFLPLLAKTNPPYRAVFLR